MAGVGRGAAPRRAPGFLRLPSRGSHRAGARLGGDLRSVAVPAGGDPGGGSLPALPQPATARLAGGPADPSLVYAGHRDLAGRARRLPRAHRLAGCAWISAGEGGPADRRARSLTGVHRFRVRPGFAPDRRRRGDGVVADASGPAHGGGDGPGPAGPQAAGRGPGAVRAAARRLPPRVCRMDARHGAAGGRELAGGWHGRADRHRGLPPARPGARWTAADFDLAHDPDSEAGRARGAARPRALADDRLPQPGRRAGDANRSRPGRHHAGQPLRQLLRPGGVAAGSVARPTNPTSRMAAGRNPGTLPSGLSRTTVGVAGGPGRGDLAGRAGSAGEGPASGGAGEIRLGEAECPERSNAEAGIRRLGEELERVIRPVFLIALVIKGADRAEVVDDLRLAFDDDRLMSVVGRDRAVRS